MTRPLCQGKNARKKGNFSIDKCHRIKGLGKWSQMIGLDVQPIGRATAGSGSNLGPVWQRSGSGLGMVGKHIRHLE